MQIYKILIMLLIFVSTKSIALHKIHSCYAHLSQSTKQMLGEAFHKGEILVDFRGMDRRDQRQFLNGLIEQNANVVIMTQTVVDEYFFDVALYSGQMQLQFPKRLVGKFFVQHQGYRGLFKHSESQSPTKVRSIDVDQITYIKISATDRNQID